MAYARTATALERRRPENVLLYPPWSCQSRGWGEFHSQCWRDVGPGRRIGFGEVGNLPISGAACPRAGGERLMGGGVLSGGGTVRLEGQAGVRGGRGRHS